ncbi:MAG: hypothetical protein ACI4NA_00965 [Succinivibrio sp.]
MRYLNKALLCGTVASGRRIRGFNAPQGRILCFELTTGDPSSGMCECHRVTARDSRDDDLATRCERFVVPGSMVFVAGRIRYCTRQGYGGARVAEIDASSVDPVLPGAASHEEEQNAQSIP